MALKITIIGKVHDVGYRPFLLGLAESLEIDRFFADNIYIKDKQAVEAFVDASEDRANQFVELIKRKKPENAEVYEIKKEEHDGTVMKIESYYHYLTTMQLAKIATYGGNMLSKQDSALEKQNIVIDKQDETIKVIKNESKMNREEVKNVSSKLDKTNELLEKRFSRLENDVDKIKRALIKAGIEI
jgi:Hydrogenase maturation factor